MPEVWLPVGTLLAQMRGLKVLGLNVDDLTAALGPLPQSPEALVPAATYAHMWQWAHQHYAHAGLPTALAAAIPFGAFGVLDYLAGSANTLGACCESLAAHFGISSHDTRLEIAPHSDGVWLNVRVDANMPPFVSEFTLAMIAVRLRHVQPSLSIQQTWLPGPRPDDTQAHSSVFGTGVVYAAPLAAMALTAEQWRAPLPQADADLHRTLCTLASQLALGQASTSGLEQSMRARLRDALPSGHASPAHMARLLGLSERTLQRRLAAQGRNFSAVVDDFCHEEALRLLMDARLAVAQVAGQLGFNEQSSFTRAFKRWTGTTPAAWRKAQSG